MGTWRWIVVFALGCRHEAHERHEQEPVEVVDEPLAGTLPIVHQADPEAAARGEALFTETALISPPPIPTFGLRSLWIVWGQPPGDDTSYWATFRDRYGMHEAPFDNGGLPLGIRDQAGMALLDCYACHAGTVAGEVVLGVANSTFDMQGLYDDLAALSSLGGLPPPFLIEDGTGARGANDAWGLGVRLADQLAPGDDPSPTYGYQRPSAWWTLKYKERMYADGSAESDGHRTMMAMLLAYGVPLERIVALEPSFDDVKHYLWSHEAPAWPFEAPAADAVGRGREVFDATCARCHGVHSGPEAAFPDRVVSVGDVGTDPTRAVNFGPDEARFVSEFMRASFGSEPLVSTGGYLAPPLVGVWARAPYFHNGSVPDLASVLDPSLRPAAWERTGSGREDFDPARVGWRYTVPAVVPGMDSREGREVYDTQRPGLSNAGHPFGAPLSDAERQDLLAYLLTL